MNRLPGEIEGDILAVEDDPREAGLLRAFLRDPPCRLRIVPDLASARAEIGRQPPDVVLLDLNLPDGDGLELCAELGQAGPLAPTVVILSGRAAGAAERALVLGARDVLAKPFLGVSLRARVAAALRDHRTTRRLMALCDAVGAVSAAASQDPGAVLEEVRHQAETLLGCQASIHLAEEDETELVFSQVLAAAGNEPGGATWRPPARVLRELAESRAVFVADLAPNDPPREPPADCSRDAVSALCVPLLASGRPLGVLFAVWHGRRTLEPEDQLIAEQLARCAAIAVDRARAREQQTQLRETLSLLQERERIAMELHDGTIQSLYGVTLSVGAAARLLPEHPGRAGETLEGLVPRLNGAIEGIRAYVQELRCSPPRPGGPTLGLEALIAEFQSAGVAVALVTSQQDPAVEPRLDPEVSTHVLAIAREAVSNAVRHASARRIVVQPVWQRRQFALMVRDDGRGFDPDGPPESGDGLRNMAERARRIGARLSIVSRPGAGTEVRLELPPLSRPCGT